MVSRLKAVKGDTTMQYAVQHRNEIALGVGALSFLIMYYFGWQADTRAQIIISAIDSLHEFQETARRNTIMKRGYKWWQG